MKKDITLKESTKLKLNNNEELNSSLLNTFKNIEKVNELLKEFEKLGATIDTAIKNDTENFSLKQIDAIIFYSRLNDEGKTKLGPILILKEYLKAEYKKINHQLGFLFDSSAPGVSAKDMHNAYEAIFQHDKKMENDSGLQEFLKKRKNKRTSKQEKNMRNVMHSIGDELRQSSKENLNYWEELLKINLPNLNPSVKQIVDKFLEDRER